MNNPLFLGRKNNFEWKNVMKVFTTFFDFCSKSENLNENAEICNNIVSKLEKYNPVEIEVNLPCAQIYKLKCKV